MCADHPVLLASCRGSGWVQRGLAVSMWLGGPVSDEPLRHAVCLLITQLFMMESESGAMPLTRDTPCRVLRSKPHQGSVGILLHWVQPCSASAPADGYACRSHVVQADTVCNTSWLTHNMPKQAPTVCCCQMPKSKEAQPLDNHGNSLWTSIRITHCIITAASESSAVHC